MYVPAGSVTPGSVTDSLNVKYVRLSYVKALAPLAITWTSTTNTEAENNLFNMLVPPWPVTPQYACPSETRPHRRRGVSGVCVPQARLLHAATADLEFHVTGK